MVSILSLWLPILVSAIFVFILSSLIHMVFGYHRNDFKQTPDEHAFAEAIRKLNIPPGQYLYPCPKDRKEMNTPEFKEKMMKGPGVILTLWPGGQSNMAPNLIQWFAYSVIVGIFAAYVAGRALGPEAYYLAVFRFVGVTAFACYAIAGWQDVIWYKRPVAVALRNTFDGLLYALVMAGTFGWLWPR
jgi:Flp pilus assembly protein TadB